MTILFLLLLFAGLILSLLNDDWKSGLLWTLAIGFAQDPIRKLTPGQPSLMVGLVLIAFLMCAFSVYQLRRQFDLRYLLWTSPQLFDIIPFFVLLLFAQAINSYTRFASVPLVAIGLSFYLAPAVALWMGFHVGRDLALLRRFLFVYFLLSCAYAITVLMDFQGVDIPAFEEVGSGILITFEGGSKSGASGLWRTSEIASWHLAAAACFSVILAFSERELGYQVLYLSMLIVFGILSVTTGRRKAQILILAFLGIYLLLFSRQASPASRERLIMSVLGGIGVSTAIVSMFLIDLLGSNFDIFLGRALTSKDELSVRVRDQGLTDFFKAFEVGGGLGLGLGAGTNLGNFNAGANRAAVRSLGYVSEGGGGRLVVELGIPGVLLIGWILLASLQLLWRNFRLIRYLSSEEIALVMGLLSFGFANLVFFFSAAQLYSDPFILVMLGVSIGPVLSVPVLVYSRVQQAQASISLAGGMPS
jgi:hypothetical protein